MSQSYNHSYLERDSTTLSNGITVHRGDTLMIGKGTRANGDFMFIETNRDSIKRIDWVKMLFEELLDALIPTKNHGTRRGYRGTAEQHALEASRMGQSFEVVRIEQRSLSTGTFTKSIKVYFAIIKLEKNRNCQVELEKAYKSREIIF